VHIGAAIKASAAAGTISLARLSFARAFALHLQFHLEILLEDVGVILAKHPNYPFVGNSSGIQYCGIRGAKVVNPKVGNLCFVEEFVAKQS